MVLGKIGLFGKKVDPQPTRIEGPTADRIAAVLAQSARREPSEKSRKPIAVEKLEQIQSELQSQIDPDLLRETADTAAIASDPELHSQRAAEQLDDRHTPVLDEPDISTPTRAPENRIADDRTDTPADDLAERQQIYIPDPDLDETQFAAEAPARDTDASVVATEMRVDDLRTLVIERGAAIIRDEDAPEEDYVLHDSPDQDEARRARLDDDRFDTASEDSRLARSERGSRIQSYAPQAEQQTHDDAVASSLAESVHADRSPTNNDDVGLTDRREHADVFPSRYDDQDVGGNPRPSDSSDERVAENEGQLHLDQNDPEVEAQAIADIIIPLEAIDSEDAADITHCVSEYLTYLLESGTISTRDIPQEAIWSSCVSDYAATVVAGGHAEYLVQSGIASGKSVAAVEACANGFVAMEAEEFGQNFADLLDIVDAVPGLDVLLREGQDTEEIEEMLSALDKRFHQLGGIEELAKRQQAWIARLPNLRIVPLDDWQDAVEAIARQLQSRS